MHEAQLYEDNCFVTLTYDDDHLPSNKSINYCDFQRFMKRLRKHFQYLKRMTGDGIRFFACGEYGDEFSRPHFHAALFNVGFRGDRYPWRKSGGGFAVDRSPTLEILWPFGSSEIGSLTTESAGYIARYALKKVTGDRAHEHYKDVDRDTGEIVWKEPECVHMSLKPGIGGGWLSRFSSDVYPHDRVVVGGVETKPPRYYDRLLKRRDPFLLEELQAERSIAARERWPDNTLERLSVRKEVQVARIRSLKRGLK